MGCKRTPIFTWGVHGRGHQIKNYGGSTIAPRTPHSDSDFHLHPIDGRGTIYRAPTKIRIEPK
jgi:hypothetical protein